MLIRYIAKLLAIVLAGCAPRGEPQPWHRTALAHGILVAFLCLGFLLGLPVYAGFNTWTSNGPGNPNVLTLAIDPTTPTTFYAGRDGDGVFKTTGGRWTGAQSDLVFVPDAQTTSDLPSFILPFPEAAIAEVPVAVNLEPLGAASPTLRLSRPDGTTYGATRFGFQRRGVRDYVWRGHLGSPTSPAGEVTLTVRNGLLAGLVTLANTVYEIVPRSEESAVLVEVDQDRFPPCGVESAPVAATAPSEEPSPSAASSASDAPSPSCPRAGTTILDVLALYTPAARDLWGASFVEHRIQLAVDIANTAFQTSCVDAQLRLVHTALVDYIETGDSFAALDWVTNETNDPNGTVSQLRNDHAADLVSLFVSGGLCGVAHVMRTVSMSFESQAEQVIELGCAVSGLGYPHEVGHNLGAEHNPENGIQPPSLASYPWSYGHYVNGQFRTIMSYPDPCANGCPKVQLFSNPDLTFNGFPTGIADQRDNHRTFNLTVSLVANFRTACGNGSVEAGEQCDDGAANGTEASCCTATCQFAAAGSACAGGACDGMNHCGPTVTTTSTTTSTTATQPSPPCGDVNGDGVVNIGDALVIAQLDVGLRQCSQLIHSEVCDVNGDGACNIGDALRMAQCDVGLIGCAFSCVPFTCPSTTTTTTTTPIPPCSNIGGSCGSCVGGGVCVQLCGHSCTLGCLAIQGNTGGTCTGDGQCPPGKLCATNPNECPADCGPTLAAVCAFPCP